MIKDQVLYIGIAHGLGNARKMLEGIIRGDFHFNVIEKRQQAIYREDAGKPKRKSHENEMVMKLHRDYTGEP